MNKRLALATSTLIAAASSFAAGTADTVATGAIDNLKATYDVALPVGLGIMGTILAVLLVRKLWQKFAK